MVDFIVNLIIILLICGFVYWIWTLIRPRLTFIAEPFIGIVDILVIVLLAAIVLFYAVIPLLRMLPRNLKLSEYGLNLLPLVT